MSKTVVIIGENGHLIDVTGASQEASPRYKKFASRILGEDNNKAVLDYGWNGKKELVIKNSSTTDSKITLEAASVIVPGDLKVGDKSLDAIITEAITTAFLQIEGTPEEIDVDHNRLEGGMSCTIKLSESILTRITALEDGIQGIFKLDNFYAPGDGLIQTTKANGTKVLSVNIGDALKFESGDPSPVTGLGSIRINVNSTTEVTKNNNLPVTSGAVFAEIARLENEISGGPGVGLHIKKNEITGNYELMED